MENITQREYTLLFNAVSEAIDTLAKLKEQLISAQREAEEIIIARETEEKT